jgi:hypothetical protein
MPNFPVHLTSPAIAVSPNESLSRSQIQCRTYDLQCCHRTNKLLDDGVILQQVCNRLLKDGVQGKFKAKLKIGAVEKT